MRAVGKGCKCPSLLIFNCIKKRQKKRSLSNWKIRHFLIRAILTELQRFCWDFGSTHFAWNSYTAIYSSLCTLVHGQTCRWLTLAKFVGGLRVPIFWFNVADYEKSLGIFVENCWAHTLLGTVKRLCIPAPVHCTLVVYLANCLLFKLHCTTTWRQPGLDRGFVDRLQKLATNKQTENKQKTDSGVYRVAPATKNKTTNFMKKGVKSS